MKKTNNRKSVLYNRWKTIGWELLLLAAFNIMLASCDKEMLSGSGYVITETRATSAFTDVEIEGPMHVHLHQGPTAPVQITAEDNLMRVIDTYVSGSTLHVRIKSGVNLRNHRDIDIYLKSPVYNSIAFEGSGSVESLDTIRTDRFEYKLAGSGNARFPIVTTGRLETEIEGSGTIQLHGSARTFNSSIDGSGDVHGIDFYCEDAGISISGSGGHTLNVSHTMDVSIRGSGEVRYKGTAVVRTDIYGSGKVIKL